MTYVPDENSIPNDDMAQIRARLLKQIDSMSDTEIRIAAKSEASLRLFVSELFRSIAKILGYVIGQVLGFGTAIVTAFKDGWEAGLGK